MRNIFDVINDLYKAGMNAGKVKEARQISSIGEKSIEENTHILIHFQAQSLNSKDHYHLLIVLERVVGYKKVEVTRGYLIKGEYGAKHTMDIMDLTEIPQQKTSYTIESKSAHSGKVFIIDIKKRTKSPKPE